MLRVPRLLVVVNVYSPDLGGGVLFADLCEGLADRGFDVTVRCAVPYYPEWTDKENRNGWQIARTRENGVCVERFGLYIPRRPDRLSHRLVYEASFFASLLRAVPSPGEFDAVMVYCPLMGSVAYGAVAARAAGAPLWLNVQDLPADAAAASGIVRSDAVTCLMARVQHALFNRAGTWSTISPVMADRLAPLREHDQALHLLPNWLHRSLAHHLATVPGKSGRPPSSPVRLLYSGNIGAKQDLVAFCRALHATDAPFTFRIRGGGGRGDAVRTWVADSGDDRFEFEDLTGEDEFARALNEADLFVVTETQGAGGSFIPSKILPAMASGTPMLVVCDPDSPLGREMEEARPGPVFRWTELSGIGPLLANLPAQPDVFTMWQQAALARSRTYDRVRIMDRYADLIGRMIASGQTNPKP